MWSTMFLCLVCVVAIGVFPQASGRRSPLDELLKTRFSTTTRMAESHRVTTEEPPSHNFWEKHHRSYDDDYYDDEEGKDAQHAESSEEVDDYGEEGYGDEKFADDSYSDHKHSGKKHGDEKHGGKKHGDEKHSGKKYEGDKDNDDSYGDDKYHDDKYSDDKYDDGKYDNDNDDKYDEHKYDGDKYDGDKYDDDKWSDDNLGDDERALQHLEGRRRHSGHGRQGHASPLDLPDDYQVEDERDGDDDFDADADAYGDDASAEGGQSDVKDSAEDDGDDEGETSANEEHDHHVQNDDNSAWGGGYHISPYSERKWNTLGTRKAVDTYRTSRLGSRGHSTYRNNENEVQLAVENALRVNREHECRWPVARLVRVKDVFPQPNKRYIPHCASLHQCADDTGCCHSDTLACVAAKTHPVSLYFYSTTLGSGSGYVVEKLTFYNHTECRCEDRLDGQMPRDMALPLHTSRLQPPENRRSIAGGCRCPSHFAARRLNAGAVCLCECFGPHQICLRQRRGKDYFSQADKHCIQSGECALPGCEYGQYLRKAGRCPRKRERLNAWNAVHHRLYSH